MVETAVSINGALTNIGHTSGMPSLSLPNKLIWFAHCPKAGGTSVEQFMVARWGDAVGHLHWGWDLWWRREGWRVANPPNSPQHLIWEDAMGCLPRAPDAVFAVVRNPVTRMQSEHRWQRYGRRGSRASKALAWLPFSVWLRIMLTTAHRYPHAFDNHFRPQADFIPDGAHVFQLEDGLARVADWLAEALNEPISTADFPHAIATGNRGSVAQPEQALIDVVFADDYTRFGYARSTPALPGRPVIDRLAAFLAPLVVWFDRHGRL